MRETVDAYFAALAQRDFETACANVSPAFKSALARFAERSLPELEKTDCSSIARKLAASRDERLLGLQSKVRVRSVEVDGDYATAQLGPGQVATLEQIDGDWLVAKLDFSGATGSSP